MMPFSSFLRLPLIFFSSFFVALNPNFIAISRSSSFVNSSFSHPIFMLNSRFNIQLHIRSADLYGTSCGSSFLLSLAFFSIPGILQFFSCCLQFNELCIHYRFQFLVGHVLQQTGSNLFLVHTSRSQLYVCCLLPVASPCHKNSEFVDNADYKIIG